MGCSRCVMFSIGDAEDGVCLGCEIFRIWDVGGIACLGFGMLGMCDVGVVTCFKIWSVEDLGCFRCKFFFFKNCTPKLMERNNTYKINRKYYTFCSMIRS